MTATPPAPYKASAARPFVVGARRGRETVVTVQVHDALVKAAARLDVGALLNEVEAGIALATQAAKDAGRWEEIHVRIVEQPARDNARRYQLAAQDTAETAHLRVVICARELAARLTPRRAASAPELHGREQ